MFGFSILMAGIGVIAAYSVGHAQDADVLPGPSLPGYTTSGTLTYGQDHDGNDFSCDVPVDVSSLGGVVWYEIKNTEGCPTMIARDDVPVKANLYFNGNLVSSGSVMPDDVDDSSVQSLSFMLREGGAISVIPGLEARVDNPDKDGDGVFEPGWGVTPVDDCPGTTAYTKNGCPKEKDNTNHSDDGDTYTPPADNTGGDGDSGDDDDGWGGGDEGGGDGGGTK
jgi:hypothetical protein